MHGVHRCLSTKFLRVISPCVLRSLLLTSVKRNRGNKRRGISQLQPAQRQSRRETGEYSVRSLLTSYCSYRQSRNSARKNLLAGQKQKADTSGDGREPAEWRPILSLFFSLFLSLPLRFSRSPCGFLSDLSELPWGYEDR